MNQFQPKAQQRPVIVDDENHFACFVVVFSLFCLLLVERGKTKADRR
jgi:hypothetical protein